MEKKINTKKEVMLGLAGLIGLILVIILATTLTPASVFEGQVSLKPAADICGTVNLKSIPSPIGTDQSAVIIIASSPDSWNGKFRVSTSSGILSDSLGNEGSIIETPDKILSFGGGEADNVITVQAIGDNNQSCVATLKIQGGQIQSCTKLKIFTIPSPLTADQSAEIKIQTTPENLAGTFLIMADSGKFQLTSTDAGSHGENTDILVTKNKDVIYGGGKAGEKIHVSLLGEKNTTCKDSLDIKAV